MGTFERHSAGLVASTSGSGSLLCGVLKRVCVRACRWHGALLDGMRAVALLLLASPVGGGKGCEERLWGNVQLEMRRAEGTDGGAEALGRTIWWIEMWMNSCSSFLLLFEPPALLLALFLVYSYDFF